MTRGRATAGRRREPGARRRRAVGVVAVLTVALAAALVAVARLTASAGAGETRRSATRATTAGRPSVGRPCGTRPAGTGRYRHVVWIWMENHGADAAVGADAPYTRALARACGLALDYHYVTHPSLPNYVAATSGATQGIRSDCGPSECPTAAESVFGLVSASGRRWRAYQESMPEPCRRAPALGDRPPGWYAPKHDPAVYYTRLRRTCRRDVVPMGTPARGALAADLAADRLPAFSFLTPNLCDDTHDCPVGTGDRWLARWVSRIVASRAYRAGGTALFVTWDEGEGGGSVDCTRARDPGCRVATLVVAPSTPRGTRSSLLFTHYSLLRTTEELLALRPLLGHAGDPGTRSMRRAFGL